MGALPDLAFHAVPSWYWQASSEWAAGVEYPAGALVHRKGIEFDRYVCLKAHTANDANAPRGVSEFWRIDYEERVPINDDFVDNGVYLTARDRASGATVDLSTRVRRHGLVNTNKAGHYILTYTCDYLGVRWEGIKRKVIVYEPDWLQNAVPQIFLEYPVFRQTLQNYLDLYYELNYLADNVRLSLGVSGVTCDKYTKRWTEPVGYIDGYDGGFWTVKGYTFKDGDKVTLSQTPDEPDSRTTYHIQQVRTERPWSINGAHSLPNVDNPDENVGWYEAGDWVQYLDNIYVCVETHQVTQDTKKIKPKIIYPVVKKMGNDDIIAVQSKYWELGCRVVLVTHKVGEYRRNITWDAVDGKLSEDAVIGAEIRRFRPLVDAQGYLFEYEYTPKPVDNEPFTRHVDLTPYLSEVLAMENYDRCRYRRAVDSLPSGQTP